MACQAAALTQVTLVELLAPDDGEAWQLEGDGVSLSFTPAASAVRGGSAGAEIATVDQLCEVSGRVTLDGRQQEINAAGWRASTTSAVELAALESFRQTSGWFAQDDGIALLALRPRKARGHDADLVCAGVLAPGAASRVVDPRLSTTYAADGLPTRIGLELWFEPDTSDAGADGSEQQFPRRAAAEADGAGVDWQAAEFELHAARLRWHSRGSDGAGVYLLGRHR